MPEPLDLQPVKNGGKKREKDYTISQGKIFYIHSNP